MLKSMHFIKFAPVETLVVSIGIAAFTTPAVGQSQFDPSGYIQSSETEKSGTNGITGFGVYRINGTRYFQFVANEGEVFLPAIGDRAEIRQDVAVCRQHLRLKRESLMIRDKLKPEAWVKESETSILPLIFKCVEGAIEGPTVVIEKPDGSTIEVKGKKGKSREVETKVDR